jgi:hypothetical protein
MAKSLGEARADQNMGHCYRLQFPCRRATPISSLLPTLCPAACWAFFCLAQRD